jgi:predicted nucleic acid-binding protein
MKPQRIEHYTFKASDGLLLDANIWLFLYCPHGDPKAHGPAIYSAAFKNILVAKSNIYLSSIVLGEFIYRYCRLAHGLLLAKNAAPEDFKDFRRTAPFKQVAKAVGDAGRRVLKNAHPIDDDFTAVDVMHILADFEAGKQDFNDLLIGEICRRNKLTLVTDDEDFSAQGFPILTANALLAK